MTTSPTDAPIGRKGSASTGQAKEDREPPTVPSEARLQLKRPSTHRYRQLVAELARADQAAEAGGDELSAILRCIVSITHFLDADDVIRGTGLTRPLGVLATSLRDLGQGARPRLFFGRPKKKGGRPKDVSFEAARGAIAAALAGLVEGGELRSEASKFVTDTMEDAGIKMPNGKPVSTQQVLRWRDEIGSRASHLAENTYRDARAKYAKVPPEVMADEQCRKAILQGSLLAVWSKGF